ncbi:N-acetyl-gamma-glutamyl-phosphate reductase [Jatrophihabitans telluris]|uniref:N-acetyl-gamma-glutamyl-phosphate reductase n=1 Tax=Jatrophihabitans telluris TaxID=2038343 RepID=A0ABY4R2E7_9ACTN|nr:N-acetyl-gamma-glutamyl-phosphate reductase [Jatrophihabitans telluris]UQX90101.1 N-acetyl-gamma-glutamyl-phosphate reductase [Jatrophihabitans telluris]
MGISVAVAGASGYAGGELLRLLAGHPGLDVVAATAHANAGQRITELHPNLVSYGELRFSDTSPGVLAAADLVFLALPHGASATLAAELPESVKIVDLGADFRLTDAAAWQRYYGGPHAGSWTYGLPELPGQRTRIAASGRVANTGCYAVSIITALAPLIAAGLVEVDDVVVVASSGTSGAGRSAKLNLLASEVAGDLSGYKVGAHQHVAEILQATGARSVSMTPILAPMPRGILSTVTARPVSTSVTSHDIREVLIRAYADEPFIHVLPAGRQPHTAATAGSNSVHLQAEVDISSGRVIVTSAIDNLGKGAAGQALQNANLMMGLDETTGLSANGIAP